MPTFVAAAATAVFIAITSPAEVGGLKNLYILVFDYIF
jgi:hypothetical protein